jgi:integrase
MFRARSKAASLPIVRLHDLRHGYATHGIENGVPLPVISGRLGHASVKTTVDIYSHVTAAADQAAANLIAAAIDR